MRLSFLQRVRHLPSRNQRAVSLLGLICVFVPVSLRRLIDGDEGYLLYAARMVADGGSLYSDFFCPQAPLVPNVFAALFAITGPTWFGARLLAALIAIAIGALVFEFTLFRTKSSSWALVATFLFASCGLSVAWFPLVKTYGLCTVFLLAGVWILERDGRRSAYLGGLLIILAAQARLYLGIVGINAIVFLLMRHGLSRRGVGELLRLAAGALTGLSLLLPPFIRDFEAASFGMFEFARVRFPDQTSLFGSFEQKWQVLQFIFPLSGTDGAASGQLLILVVLAFGLIAARTTGSGKCINLAHTVWPTIFVANLLPNHTFAQYACLIVPFLCVEAVTLLGRMDFRLAFRPLLPGLVLYGLMGMFDGHRFVNTGIGVLGVGGQQPEQAWRIGNVKEVSKLIDAQGIATAASWWPGYFVMSQTTLIPELANDFGFNAAPHLSPERRARLHLITRPELWQRIAAHKPRLFVHGNWAPAAAAGELAKAGYTQRGKVVNATVWVYPR